MIFYLQHGKTETAGKASMGWAEARTFLDDHIHFQKNEVIAEFEASDWLDARRQVGNKWEFL